jgi:Tol biopolymer transport system component
MQSLIRQRMISGRAGLIVLGTLLLIALATGCSFFMPPGTPTLPSGATPTASSPLGASSPASATQSPAAVSVAGTPTEAPTKVAFAVSPTPESVARPTNTSAPAPKPGAPTGKFAYTIVTGREPKFFTIWVANANGSSPHQILTHAQWPTFSPDGKQIAYFGRPEGKSEGLYVANSDGGGAIGPLVIGPGVCCMNWSRDGNWIVYANTLRPHLGQPGGPISMLKMDGAYKTVINLGVEGNGPTFSPDGKQVLYSGSPPNTSTLGLMVIPATGGTGRQLTTDNGGNADFSPRGDQIVYHATDNAGHRQVYVITANGSGKKQLTRGTSNDGQPAWSRDGGSIFWRSDQNGTAWAVYVMNADGTNPRKLIDNAVPDQDLWGWESLSAAP